MHIGRLSCLFNAHKPARRSIEWDGLGYIGTCKSCSGRIRRISKGAWHKVDVPQPGPTRTKT
jgi:hypothetical protein